MFKELGSSTSCFTVIFANYFVMKILMKRIASLIWDLNAYLGLYPEFRNQDAVITFVEVNIY